jgi:membrane protein involved in colicin uptake
MRDTSLVDNFVAEEVRKAEEAKKAEAEAKARADVEAAAERERQAAAAQRRMNDNYETGYVPPNIFTSGTGGSSSGRGSRGSRRR